MPTIDIHVRTYLLHCVLELLSVKLSLKNNML